MTTEILHLLEQIRGMSEAWQKCRIKPGIPQDDYLAMLRMAEWVGRVQGAVDVLGASERTAA